MRLPPQRGGTRSNMAEQTPPSRGPRGQPRSGEALSPQKLSEPENLKIAVRLVAPRGEACCPADPAGASTDASRRLIRGRGRLYGGQAPAPLRRPPADRSFYGSLVD